MIGTFNCVYETPCGWCSKWDKKCDKKIPKRGQRAECNSVDDKMNEDIIELFMNIICKSEKDYGFNKE